MVICYWLATPEGAALFRPTCMGIGGGVVFGWQCRKALRFSGLHIWVSVVVWCLVGNAGRRFAFPAYIFGYLRWFDVWRGLRFTSPRIPQEYQKRRVEKPQAPSTNAKALNTLRKLPKQTLPTYRKTHNLSATVFV